MVVLKILSAAAAIALLGVVGVSAIEVAAQPAVKQKPAVQKSRQTYKLPEDTSVFKPGPNLDVVQKNCLACHSADYVQVQPRGPKFKNEFWQAEVTKMIKVYGAPIDEADVGKIVDYLAQTY